MNQSLILFFPHYHSFSCKENRLSYLESPEQSAQRPKPLDVKEKTEVEKTADQLRSLELPALIPDISERMQKIELDQKIIAAMNFGRDVPFKPRRICLSVARDFNEAMRGAYIDLGFDKDDVRMRLRVDLRTGQIEGVDMNDEQRAAIQRLPKALGIETSHPKNEKRLPSFFSIDATNEMGTLSFTKLISSNPKHPNKSLRVDLITSEDGQRKVMFLNTDFGYSQIGYEIGSAKMYITNVDGKRVEITQQDHEKLRKLVAASIVEKGYGLGNYSH